MVNDSGIAKDGFAVKSVSFIARGYYSGCPLDSIDVQHHMVVVRHHRVGGDIDAEDLG